MRLERGAKKLDSLSRGDMSSLSRRDKRTQPGVSTPGTDKKMARPEGAEERDFALPNVGRDLEPTFCHPFRADSWAGRIPGVKTAGLVLLSLRDKFERSLRDTIFE